MGKPPRNRCAGGGFNPPTPGMLKRRGCERAEKRQGVTLCGEDQEVERKRCSADVSKPLLTASRPEVAFDAGPSPRGTCLLLGRRPACRRRQRDPGSREKRGNLTHRWQWRPASGGSAAGRVPSWRAGAEQPVAAGKVLSRGRSDGPAVTGLDRGSNRCREDSHETCKALPHPVWAGWLGGAV